MSLRGPWKFDSFQEQFKGMRLVENKTNNEANIVDSLEKM